VLELGYFIGRLGRSSVCALRKGDVEIPNDIAGVLYTPMDDAGAWKVRLATEINAAGIDVDLNKLK
jgi:predicted nucleotide-binding protein